jgi:hypothetical protein
VRVLVEKITVIPKYVEGGQPRWLCTNPTEQYAVGVWTWRRVEGSWVPRLLAHEGDHPFVTQRVRLVVGDWPGFPREVTLFDVIGELEEDDLKGRLAQIEMLWGAIKRVTEKENASGKLY